MFGSLDAGTNIVELVGCWLLGFYDSTRDKDDTTVGDTAIPGMTSLKDGDLQHSSALAQSPKEI